ncbi:MAG: SPOR domain-containing protein [Ignavibacteria bacterium]|nr:SPOR domain-containing protein [Ignavibacteria bacterium]MCC7159182.1 SPOR domain-containing protein [Ignavibacteria bacterium]
MLKFVKLYLLFIVSTIAVLLNGCSSGEYDVDEYKVDYTEKTVKADTIRKVTLKDDKIKEDKTDLTKDSYIYIVQIGAFSIPSNFDRFLARAKQTLGDGVYYDQTGGLYKIRIGSYTNRAEAIKYMEFAKTKGYHDAFVITRKK